MIINNKAKEKLPAYITEIYGDLYKSKKKCISRDKIFKCKVRSFFQYSKLVNAVTSELNPKEEILQFGITFGSQIDETASTIGPYGTYNVIDINPLRVNLAKEKYGGVYRCLNFFKQDATTIKENEFYDAVICFMLLSEVPPMTKTKIVNAALKQVKPKGKVIFIDWHNPVFYHPLRYVVRMVNRLHHPFVEKLWDRQIDTYADTKLKNQFVWKKSTYFGRMFQKVVATRKQNPTESKESEIAGN